MSNQVATSLQVCKVDAKRGLVFGFAVVCKQGDQDYFDAQADHISEDEMMEAATEFMANARLAREMHDQDSGTVIYAFPLTSDIAKALEIQTPMTGLLIGMKPSPEVFKKFEDGTYTGFSIGGTAVREEVA